MPRPTARIRLLLPKLEGKGHLRRSERRRRARRAKRAAQRRSLRRHRRAHEEGDTASILSFVTCIGNGVKTD